MLVIQARGREEDINYGYMGIFFFLLLGYSKEKLIRAE